METVQTMDVVLRPRGRWSRSLLRFFRTKPLGTFGSIVVLLLVLTAIAAPYIAPYDPFEQREDSRFRPPSREFLLGTDDFGRDLLSRIIWGSRISISVGFGAVAFGTVLGSLLGIASGFFRGTFDIVVQRFVDAMLAFPTLVLLLVIVTVLSPSIANVIFAIAIGLIPSTSRVLRSQAMAVKENEYLASARAIGATTGRILVLHVAPNCVAPIIILASAQLSVAIITEASLSFLGLGVPPPNPSWGAMLSGSGRRFAELAPWMAIFPGIALSLVVYGFNLLGDALRDTLDPRLRR